MNLDPRRHLFLHLVTVTALAAAGCSAESEPQDRRFEVHPLSVPAAPGSTGPNLAAGPDGTIVLSWTEPDGDQHRLVHSTLVDDAWSDPALVAGGDNWFVNWADFPSVVPLSGSLWAAHWLERQPAGGYAYDVLLSLSNDGGSTWSQPLKPHSDNTPTEHGFVTLFPSGADLGAIWLDGRNMINPPSVDEITDGMALRAATIKADATIADEGEVEIDGLTCDCCQTDVAITDQGAVAVYRDRTEAETRDIYAARLIEGDWQPGRAVADDGWTINGCPVNGPVIAAEGERVAVAWFTAADDRPRVRIARSEDSGASFSMPVDVVEQNTAGRVGLALLPDNALAVSWVCESPEDTTGMCLRTVSSTGEPGAVHWLSGDQAVPSFSVPQLARSGDLLVAAWTTEVDAETAIASAKFPIESLLHP